MLHGESNIGQASPRTTIQRTCQTQEAVQPNATKSYSNSTPPRKSTNNPTNGHTPRRTKPTHTHLTYTRMRPHAPCHQAGDHPVPAHPERHNPSKVWAQRQSGLPPRAASSQGQRHRCRSIRKQSVWGSQAGGRGLEEAGGGRYLQDDARKGGLGASVGGRPRLIIVSRKYAAALRSASKKKRDCTVKVLWMRQENVRCIHGRADRTVVHGLWGSRRPEKPTCRDCER